MRAPEAIRAPTEVWIATDPSLAQGLDRVVADGLTPHQGENRRMRRAAVAQWVPPRDAPSRRELLEQRQKRARGTLDPELRRLQRRKLKEKKR